MFRLTLEEAESLRFQIETSKIGRGGNRYLPYVFTEHGVAMLSSVLKSDRAVDMGISIVRAFIKLREMLATHKDLAHKIEELERTQKSHGRNLSEINSVLNELMNPPKVESKSENSKNPIGFSEKDGILKR
jgi:phage regulator Rha-like protein